MTEASHREVTLEPLALSPNRRLSATRAMPIPTSAHHPFPADVGRQRYCGAVGLDVGLHSDLHAGLVADRRGDELVAGGR